MLILALETCFGECSVSLGRIVEKDAEIENLSQSRHLEPNMQTEILIALIDRTVKQAGIKLSDLDYIIVNRGPGSFTGVRIGLAAAFGLRLKYQDEIDIMAISSFKALWHAYNYKNCAVILPAGKGQYYAKRFEVKESKETTDDGFLIADKEDAVLEFANGLPIIGKFNATSKLNPEILAIEELPQSNMFAEYAANVIIKGLQSDYMNLNPLYIRKPDAYKI